MARNVAYLDLDLGFDEPVTRFDIADPENTTFCEILNRANQLAFGGEKMMGMPLWVMLDCAILPGAMLGFMMRREQVPSELAERLHVPSDYVGWVPISEYSACGSIEPGTGSGFSLQTQIEKSGIGTQTKALALAALGFERQVGVTQFDNPAIRVHSRFGRLEILVHRPIVHTHAQNSFVYSVDLPSRSTLIEMAHGSFPNHDPVAPTMQFDPSKEDDHDRLAGHLRSGGRAWIEPPGWFNNDGSIALPITLEQSE